MRALLYIKIPVNKFVFLNNTLQQLHEEKGKYFDLYSNTGATRICTNVGALLYIH